MRTNPLDQTYITPMNGFVMKAWLDDEAHNFPALRVVETGDDIVVTICEIRDGVRIVRDTDMVLLETIAHLPAGTVVRLAPMLGDAFEMASFLDGKDADALVACEMAAGLILGIVEDAFFGMEAVRTKGKWRPIDEAHRRTWSDHCARVNVARMQMAAETRKAA